MPNYVYNRLQIDNDTLAKKIFDYMHTDECDFDFNQIVPMPDDILEVISVRKKENSMARRTGMIGRLIIGEPSGMHAMWNIVAM